MTSSPGIPTPPSHRLILIRHGETEWSLSGRHTGRTDKPLTEAGRQQAAALSRPLTELKLNDPVVISSPRVRARNTAELAGLTVSTVWDDTCEWDYGDYEGLTSCEIRASRPGWNLWTDGAPGGESVADMTARVDGVIAKITSLLAGRDVIVVSHGHFSRVMLARWIEAPIALGERFAMLPASIAVARLDGESPQITVLGVTGYRSTGYADAGRPRRAEG